MASFHDAARDMLPPMVRRRGGRAAVVACVGLAGCASIPVTGTVFIDANGDGLRQRDEPPVPNAIVGHARTSFTRTDAAGGYRFDVPELGGQVWVRVPDGFRPGPVWRRVDETSALDLGVVPLTPAEAAAPVTFIVASDSHVTANPADPWDGGDLDAALAQLLDLPAPPRFFTIVGDMTQGNKPAEFARLDEALARVAVPWVPVAGNHDWYDGGQTYRDTYGVDSYSFDIGELHVIVWDTNLTVGDQIAFIAADLATVRPTMTVVALGHASPTRPVADEFARLGVDYLFTGHWHANRRVDRGAGLVEWGTQTFTMGGIDASPSGYRIVTFEGAVPSIVHREVMISPHVDVTAPRPGACVSPDAPLEIIAAVATGAGRPEVSARVDCDAPVALTPSTGDGWTYRGEAGRLREGAHVLALTAVTPAGEELHRQVEFQVCGPPAAPAPVTAAWPQLGGGPGHAGHQLAPITGPLRTWWTTTIGGTPALGTPVVADDVVVISVVDRGQGDQGGLVALDLRTGAERWRITTGSPLVNAPAIADGIVVAALSSGEVVAHDLGSGVLRWRVDLATGLDPLLTSLWAAPTIADGVVYAGIQGNFAALDLVDGEVLWSQDPAPVYPWLGSRAAPAVADQRVFAALNRDLGLASWAALDGMAAWRNQTGATTAVNASPVIAADVVYVASVSGDVTALDVADGRLRWGRRVTLGGFEWGYSIIAAPAVADGRLFVPTQWQDLVALDAASGMELWRAYSPMSPINFAHYRSDSPGFLASPVVTGDVVWVGRPDGRLLALAASDGRELWSTQLGAPIVTSPAPAGEVLVVATYDGTVRALIPGAQPPPTPAQMPTCAAGLATRAPTGCASGSGQGLWLGVLALGLLVRRRTTLNRRRALIEGGVPVPPSAA